MEYNVDDRLFSSLKGGDDLDVQNGLIMNQDSSDAKHEIKTEDMNRNGVKSLARNHGSGVVLYLDFVKLSGLLCGFCFFVWALVFIIEHLFRKGGTELNFIDWWIGTLHVIPLWISVLIVLVFSIYLQRRQKRLWSSVLKTNDSIATRSVLVSSRAFKGSLGMVPSGSDLANFFSENYGRVENVLMLLDIGRLVRLRRMRGELKQISIQAEQEHHKYKPRKGYLSKMICCRTCRKLARQAGEKRQDRYDRWMEKINTAIQIEEDEHQVESIGCAIVTFEDRQDAVSLLLDNSSRSSLLWREDEQDEIEGLDDSDDETEINFANEFEMLNQDLNKGKSIFNNNTCFKNRKLFLQPTDHALDWWFSPSLLCSVRYGEEKQPIFASYPPEPEDLNFESLVDQGTQLGSPTFIYVFIRFVVAVLLFFGGGLFGLVLLAGSPNVSFLGLVFTIVCVVALCLVGLFLGTIDFHVFPIRPFTTNTLRQVEFFRWGYVLTCCAVSGYATGLLFVLDYIHPGTTVGFAILGLLVFQLVAIARSAFVRRNRLPFVLGLLHAEVLCSLTFTFFLLPWAPLVLITTTITHLLKYYLERQAISRCNFGSRFGPDVAITCGNWFPIVAVVGILPCSLLNFMNEKGVPYWKLLGGFVAVCITITFTICWFWILKHYPLLFKYPLLEKPKPKPPQHQQQPSSSTQYFPDEEEFKEQTSNTVNISFSPQLLSHKDIGYQLPQLKNLSSTTNNKDINHHIL